MDRRSETERPHVGGKLRPEGSLGQKVWRRVSRAMANTFYRRHEVAGLENLPAAGPAILCANHVNALVDALVVQSTCPRPVHPLARSGLFANPLLRPLLALQQAVPISRRRDSGGADDPNRNQASFERCFEILARDRVLLIFPEGQSHSDPTLRPLKTGAARLALGHLERTGAAPAVVPVGLTFTEKGRFRSNVLVMYGEPIRLEPREGESVEQTVRRATAEIERGLKKVTLNAESWNDIALVRLLQRFFLLRRGRRSPTRSLAHRFRTLQRLLATLGRLRSSHPARVKGLTRKLRRFEALCRRYGVKDYQLHLDYPPKVVARFVLRSLAFVLFVFPLTLWGVLNSALPYGATRLATRRAARGRDQYDTAGMLFGLLFFLLFWGGQTFAVSWLFGRWGAVAYAASLPLTTAVALKVGYARRWIWENVRVFFLFQRRGDVREFLHARRREIEHELAELARIARWETADA